MFFLGQTHGLGPASSFASEHLVIRPGVDKTLTDVAFCRMVPQNYTVPQTVTGTKTVNVTQPMQRTISKVIEGQKIVEQPHVLEYERPRMIPGRVINEDVLQTRVNLETLHLVARLQDLGIQWTIENTTPSTPNS